MLSLALPDTGVLVDIAAEQSAVALAHLRPDEFAALGLEPDHFADPALRALAEGAQSLARSGSKQRVLDWAQEPQRAKRFAEALTALEHAAPGNPKDVARRLATKRTARRVWSAVDGVRAAIGSGSPSKLAEAAQRVSEAALENTCSDITTLADVVLAAGERVATMEPREGWVRPPMPTWRNALGWIKPGTLWIIAAPTNVGKSQGALHLMTGIGASGTKVGYISVEDEQTVAGQRGLARLSGVSTDEQDAFHEYPQEEDRVAILRRLCDSLDRKRVKAAYENVLFAERVGAGVSEIEATVLRLSAAGAKVIAVDYLQEIDTRGGPSRQPRHEAVSELVRRLKALAVRQRFALVLVSQLNRTGSKEVQKGAPPSMYDLKESGDIENKSEMVITMHRDDDHGCVVLTLAKAKGRPNTGEQWYMAPLSKLGGMLGDIEPPPGLQQRGQGHV